MTYKIGAVFDAKFSKTKYTLKANYADLWICERGDGSVVSFFEVFLAQECEPYVEPKEKVIMTEFLCWHNYEAFPQTRWAKSKENAEKFCSDNGYKLLQWGLRTVEVEEG